MTAQFEKKKTFVKFYAQPKTKANGFVYSKVQK